MAPTHVQFLEVFALHESFESFGKEQRLVPTAAADVVQA